MKLLQLFFFAAFSLACASAHADLSYKYYEGNWTNLPDLASLTALKSGSSASMDLSIRSRDNFYAVLWTGFITIPADGTYTFETLSDDGSMLYIGQNLPLVVNNDGQHGTQSRTGSLYLSAGTYPIKMAYMNACCEGTLQLYWSSTSGISKQLVPASALSLTNTPASAAAGLDYSYFEGNWTNIPDLSSMTALKSGSSASPDLSIRNRENFYAVLWTGFITVPADGTYTFETLSDDGSMVYIGQSATALVNNDGQHGTQTRTGAVYLAAGSYPIRIAYMNACCDGTLQLFWSSTSGLSRQAVPASAFSRQAAATTTQTSAIAPLSSTPASTTQGLDYSYFEGNWANLPDLTAIKALKTGAASTLDLSVRSRDNFYALLWTGYLTVPASATYTFETICDDGSMIYLGQTATTLVDNDGQHGSQSRTATLFLSAGVYPIRIAYMNACCDGVMQLFWSSTSGLSRQAVPASAFSHAATAAAVTITPVVTVPSVETISTEAGGLTASLNYYFSASTGDDSRSAAQAQSPSTPWKTLARLNSVLATAQPGTAFLLKRGDSFDGALYMNASGAAGNPIILSAYGTGAKPVINGFASTVNWTAAGNGIWEAQLSTTISRMNMVARDGQVQPMGRFPNTGTANRGYLTFEGHSGTSTITDDNAPAMPNWTGAELVIRKNRWTLDRGTITAHNGGTMTCTDPSGMEPLNGFGYFIQNDARTLDQLGEWYFNASTKKVQLYTGGASPAAYGFRTSVVDTLVTIRSKNWITLDNIALQGANCFAMAVWDNANNITVQNCAMDFSGINAVTGNYTRAFSLTGSVINHSNNSGLYLAPYCWNTTVKNNVIKNTGMIPGMGSSNNQAHEGMTVDGAGSLIQYNTVDSTGYIAIAFARDSVQVINNFVNHFCMTTDDGGGIYTHDRGFYGRRIVDNVILNGVGASEGTDIADGQAANGVGLDDYSTDVEISGNTIANCYGRGIGLHNSQNIIVKGNTAYNNQFAQVQFDHDQLGPDSPIRGILLQNNVLVSRKADQAVLGIRTMADDAAQFGTGSGNYYCRPVDDGLTFNMVTYANTWAMAFRQYDLAHWKTFSGQDNNSVKSPVSIAPYTVGSAGANLYGNASFDAGLTNVFNFASDRNAVGIESGVLDGAALKVNYTSKTSGSFNALWFYNNLNPGVNPTLLAGHTYRLKLSIKGGQGANTTFRASLNSATGTGMPGSQTFIVYDTRKEVELLFTPSADVPTAYVSVWTDEPLSCPVYWLDNLALQEVSGITYTNVDDYLRFEYNAGTSAKTVSLDGTYVDMKGQVYNGSVTIGGYSSVVLIKKGSTMVQDQAQQVNASAVAVTEGVSEPVLPTSVKVSPNPATSQIQLTHGLSVKGTEAGVVSVYNAAGTVVKQYSQSVSSQAITIVVSDLKAGVYTVKLDCGGKSVTARFVKL